MGLLSDRERRVVQAVAALATGNPFLPERIDHERRALGRRFRHVTRVWHEGSDLEDANPNVARLGEQVERLGPELRERLAAGRRAEPAELEAYRGLVFYLLYYRSLATFTALVEDGLAGRDTSRRVADYDRFRADARHFLGVGGAESAHLVPAHLFAWGFQIRRAFEETFRGIQGGSLPAARLRAAVWQSIFTHESRRYGRSLHARMAEWPTLVLGESGTGKELVARAIGRARYVAFDEKSQSFTSDFASAFRPVNLSALAPTLIESELFGHRKGAFTGALQDRAGWLEECSEAGTVFLDEIGELDAQLQVKLLRVLQSRRFQRVGETRDRVFQGKLVAATNRDLTAEIEAGRFREDLYYRLCADIVETPTLREQIQDAPESLPGLVSIITRRIVGEPDADALTREVLDFVHGQLGLDYPWPGNVRELEQCVRNVLIRGRYTPARRRTPDPAEDLAERFRAGDLRADELLRRYCTLVYARTGSYEEAARRLGLDRRTVKTKLDPERLP